MTTITPIPVSDGQTGMKNTAAGMDKPASNEDVFLGQKPQEVGKADERSLSTPTSVEEAIVHFKQQIQSLRRELEFTFDEETRQVIIKVHDSETGEVVRQIPSEEFVAMARRLGETRDARLIDTQA